jgi:hypothetical protein
VTFGKLPSATGIGWAKNQFIEVHLEAFATDAVMGADQPLARDYRWQDPPTTPQPTSQPFKWLRKRWLRGACLNPASLARLPRNLA